MAFDNLFLPTRASNLTASIPTLNTAYTVGDGNLDVADISRAATGENVVAVTDGVNTWWYLHTGKTTGVAPAGTLNSLVFLETDHASGVDANHAVEAMVFVTVNDIELIKRMKNRIEAMNPADGVVAADEVSALGVQVSALTVINGANAYAAANFQKL